jgi:glycerol-1-phosphate dehydrogenase [NAD(P)+]
MGPTPTTASRPSVPTRRGSLSAAHRPCNPVAEPELEVVIAPDALARLAGRLASERWPGALVVMDANTRQAAGADAASELAQVGVDVHELVFEQRDGLLAGRDEVKRVRERIADGREVIAVGSGVITDIVRYAAHQSDRDFVSVPTAASMDGYASGVAALQLDGVKVTYPARAPKAIYADPRVVAGAPPELTRAGIGDLLAKASARTDWLAAHLLYGERFDPQVAQRVQGPLSVATSTVPELLAGDPEAIEALLRGLVESGIAMAIFGSSRPASGCEHHASHFWDLLAARGRRPHAPHGLQAGYATHFALRLQRHAFAAEVASLHPPIPPTDPLDSADARDWLGDPSAEIAEAVADKQRYVEERAVNWPADQLAWNAVRARLAPALSAADEVERALSLAGIPAEPGYLDVDERTLRATFRHATRLRARYTTVDFLDGQRALEPAVDAMLA